MSILVSPRSIPAILGGAPACKEKIPFVRPAMPDPSDMEDEIREMLASGQLTKGAHLRRFEEAIAEHLGVRHAVGVSSCTSGLMLTYQALNVSGEVIVPSFTFMATVSSLVWAGAKPIFVDVNPHTATIDPGAVEKAITRRTTAIVGVHTFGNPADIKALEEIAHRHGLKLIFDAAHGFGSLYQGAPVGRQGSAQVFSLSPTKLLVAGEGGIVATNDDVLAEQLRLGREYGNDGSYDSAFAGMNARLGEFNALLGLHSLRMLEDVAQRRNEVADRYRSLLADVPGIEFMEVAERNRCSYKDLSVLIDQVLFGMSRDQLASALLAENIDTRNYYSPAVHRHRAYTDLGGRDELLPHTMKLAAGSISLPIGTHISDESVQRVCDAIRCLHDCARAVVISLERNSKLAS
jgi:dTDP-4-amino-4,6-dideoxygalactose transaminase